MQSSKQFFVTAGIILLMTVLAWRYGYSAGSLGERADLTGAAFVALGFITIGLILKGLAAIWRMVTDSGPGISPSRYVAISVVILVAGFLFLGMLAPLAIAGDSWSLGIVMTVTALLIYQLAKRDGLIAPVPVRSYMGMESRDSEPVR